MTQFSVDTVVYSIKLYCNSHSSFKSSIIQKYTYTTNKCYLKLDIIIPSDMQSCKKKTIRHPLQCSMLSMKIEIKANWTSLPAVSLCSCTVCVYANATVDQTHTKCVFPGWLDSKVVWAGATMSAGDATGG